MHLSHGSWIVQIISFKVTSNDALSNDCMRIFPLIHSFVSHSISEIFSFSKLISSFFHAESNKSHTFIINFEFFIGISTKIFKMVDSLLSTVYSAQCCRPMTDDRRLIVYYFVFICQ